MYCTVVSVVIQFYPWLKVYFQLEGSEQEQSLDFSVIFESVQK